VSEPVDETTAVDASAAEHAVWIAADHEAVFAALTTVDGLNGWWGPASAASSAIGGHVVFDHGLPSPMRMEIVTFDAPSRVTWRFASTYDDPDNPASEWTDQSFAWRVEPRAERSLLGHPMDVTVVRMTNAGWPAGSRWRGFCTTAWGATLDGRLKPFLEEHS
jgi:uncharacterized protein YndB with AHSA1/START domain